MTTITRRAFQLATALVLASTVVLVTQWAYPAGHLAIHLGRPEYSRVVGESDVYVMIDLRVQNVGVDPVSVDREHFLLVDTAGQMYQSDPSTHFLRNHFDVTTILPLHDIRGATVFRIGPGRTAGQLIFVTTTGQIVRFRL
ncbi:MAG TPA: DUF4352 domain-containing protein [bacterium]|nr:DUF4352 domain-containing protein [bacterium]